MKELFYEDAYLKEFEAEVIEVNENKYIILDKTAFYAQSGGQPSDIGTLTRDDGEIFVVCYVGKFNNQISHEVEKHGLKPGDKVKGIINWEKRHKLMRMHTAAHTLIAVMTKNTDVLITGNQLSENTSRIDFSLENFNRDKIQEFIDEANDYIKKNLVVKSYFISKEEAEKEEELTKLAKGIPSNLKQIRIVEIKGLDRQADGGTHVKSLKEVGKINLEKLENKGSKNRRVYFSLKNN